MEKYNSFYPNGYNIQLPNGRPKEPPEYLEKAIETSKFLDCGCNYRFKKDFVERAIFFEIKDDEKNSSIWFLLPDNSFLLYIMDNERVLGFNRNDLNLREGNGLIFPCLLFSKEGKLIKNN